MQDFTIPFIELCGVSLCLFLQTLEVVNQMSWFPLLSQAVSFGFLQRFLKMLKCDLLKPEAGLQSCFLLCTLLAEFFTVS